MKKLGKWLGAIAAGIVCALLATLLSEVFLRGLGNLVGTFGGMLGLRAKEISQYSQVLGQLRDAHIEAPAFALLPICCAAMLLTARIVYSRRARRTGLRMVAAAIVWLLLMLPITLGSLWFTIVNGLRLGAVIRALLPVIQSGAL